MRRRTGKRVVITGVGPVTPVGVGRDRFWDALRAGLSGTRPLERLPGNFPVEAFRSRVVAAVPDEWLPAAPAWVNGCRHLRLGELAGRLAWEDAGRPDLRGDRVAVVLGTAVGGTSAMEVSFLQMDRGGKLNRQLAPAELPRQMSFHHLASDLAGQWGCRGPVLTVSTGCTAGLDAVAAAFELVRSGHVELAVTGSAEAPLTPVVFAAFDVIGALTQRNDDPERASRPFDRDRDGFVLAEGAALLILEERERALRRGAHRYAEVVGFASVSNSYHMTDLPADGEALAACIRLALADAGLSSEDVDHVSAHGSSTKQNDLCETNAIKAALGSRAGRITVNGLKSMVGHALGASNAIELAAGALELDRRYLCPTTNLACPGSGCDLDYVANCGRRASPRHVLKLSNGFSGIHSVLVLSEPA